MADEEKDIYWCCRHKLMTNPKFLCDMYDAEPRYYADDDPVTRMCCETCCCCHKTVGGKEKEE